MIIHREELMKTEQREVQPVSQGLLKSLEGGTVQEWILPLEPPEGAWPY